MMTKDTKKTPPNFLPERLSSGPDESVLPFGHVKPQPDFSQLFQQCIIDQTKVYAKPPDVLSINQGDEIIHCCTIEGITVVKAQAKTGKSALMALMAASFAKAKTPLDFFQTEHDAAVLIVDTEQAGFYASESQRRALKIAEVEKSDKIVYADVRAYSPDEKIKLLEAGVISTKCRFVIIDGVVDLCNGFNDVDASMHTVSELMRIASVFKVHILCILHENKKDNHARGHLGQILMQKSETVFAIEQDKNDKHLRKVSCHLSRGMPFDDFYFRWDKGDLPKIVHNTHDGFLDPASKAIFNSIASTSTAILKSMPVFEKAFEKPLIAYRHNDLVGFITNNTSYKNRWARDRIKDWVAHGHMHKGVDGLYRKAMTTADGKSRQIEANFAAD